MTDHVNETLLILIEECGEVIQAISKCQRFGMDAIKPGKSKNNREHLQEELGDLLAMISILQSRNIISEEQVLLAQQAKFLKLKKWSGIFS